MATVKELPSARRLLGIWARIGVQSFGGGPAVQLYAYTELVQKGGWISPEQWAELWGICQVVPGINLIAFAVLTGHRLAGRWGAVSSLLGFLTPSVLITLGVTLVYSRVRGLQVVHAATRGVVMAAAGGYLVMSWRILKPLLDSGRKEGKVTFAASLVVIVVVAGLVATGRLPIYAVLVAAGILMALVVTLRSRSQLSPARD